ncbi:MAG: hypothetical protein KBA26_09170, partial [Candidatus Delongbacteria bacterium]|nr:hypothetical protein [Candidatus Delongbacteria bacterium]
MTQRIVLIWISLSMALMAETYTARFLQFPIGAASLSSGNGSILSFSNETLLSNPAAVSWLNPYHAAVSYSRLPFDREQAFAGLVLQNQGIKFGLSYFEYRISDIEERNLNGELIGHFKDRHQLYILTAGLKKGTFRFGMNIKYLRESLYEQSAGAILFDLGLLCAI